jgi:hypothetical protein
MKTWTVTLRILRMGMHYIIHEVMCEEQHTHNERVWNIEHDLVIITLMLQALLLDGL